MPGFRSLSRFLCKSLGVAAQDGVSALYVTERADKVNLRLVVKLS